MPENQRQSSAAAIEALTHGTLAVVGQVTTSSNFTFLVDVDHDGQQSRAIYKPHQGEQPLWDFPDELYKREVAAYILSRALGWPDIPETVIRTDAEYGIGSLQRFVDADFSQHYFLLFESGRFVDTLKALAIFDLFANNADRKAGHCLSADDHVYAIDNALCFNVEDKLRTVIWEFGGETIDENLVADIDRVSSALPNELHELLAEEEIVALGERMRRVVSHPQLPELVSQRQYPWPLL